MILKKNIIETIVYIVILVMFIYNIIMDKNNDVLSIILYSYIAVSNARIYMMKKEKINKIAAILSGILALMFLVEYFI